MWAAPFIGLANTARDNPAKFAQSGMQFLFVGGVGMWLLFGLRGWHMQRNGLVPPPPYIASAPGGLGGASSSGGGSSDSGSGSGSFPGNNASQEQMGKWLGGVMQENGLPRPLATMIALVESGMRTGPSVRFKDHDSAGPYQVRIHLHKWTLKQAEDWEYATRNWVVKQAMRYKGNYPNTPNGIGQMAQAIQGSAYPGRYAQVYDRAMKLSGG